MNESRKHGGDHEDGEDDILHTGQRAFGVEEGKPDEQTSRKTQRELGKYVARRSPVLLKRARRHGHDLRTKGHGKLGLLSSLFVVRSAGSLSVDLLNVLHDALSLRAGQPDAVPVLAVGACSLIDNVEHVLGRVLFGVAVSSAIELKVVE